MRGREVLPAWSHSMLKTVDTAAVLVSRLASATAALRYTSSLGVMRGALFASPNPRCTIGHRAAPAVARAPWGAKSRGYFYSPPPPPDTLLDAELCCLGLMAGQHKVASATAKMGGEGG